MDGPPGSPTGALVRPALRTILRCVLLVVAAGAACSNGNGGDKSQDPGELFSDEAAAARAEGDPAGVGGCSGSYEGAFLGGDGGVFATIIYPDGRTKLVFLSAAEGFRVEGSGAVDADGLMFTTVSSGSESTGKLDSENCTAEGVWANLDLGVSGTWEMRRVSDSLTGDVARSLGCEPGSIPSHREAALIRPDFSDQDLRCGDFTLAELTEADFTNSLLDGAVFRDANLEQPLFSGSSLVSADLRDVVLTRASFIDADLRNADLRAIVVGGITFANTVCPDGLNSDETAGGACVVAPPD